MIKISCSACLLRLIVQPVVSRAGLPTNESMRFCSVEGRFCPQVFVRINSCFYDGLGAGCTRERREEGAATNHKDARRDVKFDHVKLTSSRAAVSAGGGLAGGGGPADGGVSDGRQSGAGQY